MKKNLITKIACLAAVGVALAWGSTRACAKDFPIFTWDSGVNGWYNMSWAANGSMAYDAATGNPVGSLYCYDNLDNANQFQFMGWYNQAEWDTWSHGPTNIYLFTNICFDVLWDTANSTVSIADFNGAGDSGMVLGSINSGNSVNNMGNVLIPTDADTGWKKVNWKVVITSGIDASYGLIFKKWTGSALTGKAAFWVDNITFQADENPPPPVIMEPLPATKPLQGLNIYDDGAKWDRQSIATVVTNAGPDYNYSWVDSTTPVSYSYTVATFPENSGYQTHTMLSPGNDVNDIGPDWNQSECLGWFVVRQIDGSVIGDLRYKIGQPGNNTWLFGTDTNIFGGSGSAVTNMVVAGVGGLLCSVTNTGTAIGPWTMTFSGDVNVTVNTPDGHTATGAFPQLTDAQKFAGPVTVYWGTQPNTDSLVKDVVYTSVSITGGTNTLSVDLTQPLDPLRMKTRYSDASVAFTTPTNAVYWLQWSVPDADYVLQGASDLLGTWTTVGTAVNNTIYSNAFDTAGTITPGVGWTDGSSGATLASGWSSGDQADILTYSLYSTASVVSSLNAQLNVPPGSPNISAIDMDVKLVSSGSTIGLTGDYGWFTLGVQSGAGYSYYQLYSASLGVSWGIQADVWTHIHQEVTGAAGIEVKNVDLQVYSGTDRAITGNVIIEIDNVVLTQAGIVQKSPYTINGKHSVFINSDNLPSSGSGFFRLARPY
jgi:hypothetical protein